MQLNETGHQAVCLAAVFWIWIASWITGFIFRTGGSKFRLALCMYAYSLRILLIHISNPHLPLTTNSGLSSERVSWVSWVPEMYCNSNTSTPVRCGVLITVKILHICLQLLAMNDTCWMRSWSWAFSSSSRSFSFEMATLSSNILLYLR